MFKIFSPRTFILLLERVYERGFDIEAVVLTISHTNKSAVASRLPRTSLLLTQTGVYRASCDRYKRL